MGSTVTEHPLIAITVWAARKAIADAAAAAERQNVEACAAALEARIAPYVAAATSGETADDATREVRHRSAPSLALPCPAISRRLAVSRRPLASAPAPAPARVPATRA